MLKSTLRAALNLIRWAGFELGGLLGVAASRLRTLPQIASAWPAGPVHLGPRVALFVHFDGQGRVRRYVLDYLAALRAAELDIVFVTNSGRLEPAAQAQLQQLCATVIVRRNVGYDFCAMKDGLQHLGLPRANTQLLVIANDSVYGPWRPIREVLDRIDFGRADLWGATESWQRRYHLQSFFLVAGRAAMTSDAWRSFWQGVRPVQSKHWVVSRYEVGLTQHLLNAGLRCAALWPYQALLHGVDGALLATEKPTEDPFLAVRRIHIGRIRNAVVKRQPLNPTAELWRELIEAGFPFLKRELLRDNPARVADIADWRDVVRTHMPADISATELDLQRVLRNRAG